MSFTLHSALRKLNTDRTVYWCFPPKFGSFGEGVSEKKIVRNRPIRNKNCLWRTNMVATSDSCFWLADIKEKSSPLKLLSQMNRNLKWSNYGRSSIKIAHFIPIWLRRFEEKIQMWIVNGRQTTSERRRTTGAKWW
jgi:hypothetical protein